MFVDNIELKSTNIIVCPLRGCNHVWCKRCEQTIQVPGPQHSCDGSRELEHLMRARGWRHCPGTSFFADSWLLKVALQLIFSLIGCQTPVQKESGCNHMTVSTKSCRCQC